MQTDFTTVTELPHDEVTHEQIERLAQRYYWAAPYCRGRDVLEVACGAGQGLGYLASSAKSLQAGDICEALVQRARSHYNGRVSISAMDALSLPFRDESLDVVILFEAIYYLSSAQAFAEECRRVLRPQGAVLVATANKDLYDFNPSPFSHAYYGVRELDDVFGRAGFSCEFFGSTPVGDVSWRQRAMRPVKAAVVKLGLMPKTMASKKFLKRLVFGRLERMPAEITAGTAAYTAPRPVPADAPDRAHKVIYMAATRMQR